MLQNLKLNLTLLLSIGLLLGLTACSKPTSDKKARQLVLGEWKHEFGTVTFTPDGKLVAKLAQGKKPKGNGKAEDHYDATYTVTKDKITIKRDEKYKNQEAAIEGLNQEIFPKEELTITLDIVKLKKKIAVIRYKGTEYTFTK